MDEEPQQFLLVLQDLNIANLNLAIAFLITGILILISALISGSEVAFFSSESKDWDKKDKDDKKIVLINTLLQSPNKLLATILITNNFVNVAIIILSTYITSNLFDFEQYPYLKFIIQVVVVTFVLLLLGEVMPKVFANQNSLAFSKVMSRPLMILSKIFHPLSKLLVSATSVIENRVKTKRYNISVDDLSSALDLTEDKTSNLEETRILRSIVEFGNIQAKEIMKPRTDVIALESSTPISSVKELIIDSGYSRIPVYEDNFDSISGILYIKDLLPHIDKETFDWNSILRKAFFIPEGKMIDDLLRDFQEKKIHLAIVVDEYGGTSGIVTLEDIIEEIVGDINDEFDDDGIKFSKLDDLNYIFEGKTSINDVLKIINGEVDYFDHIKGESDSLAGLILEMKGNIPKQGEILTYKQYTFTIEAVDQRRVKRVKITIKDE